jgi:hypothetical protein
VDGTEHAERHERDAFARDEQAVAGLPELAEGAEADGRVGDAAERDGREAPQSQSAGGNSPTLAATATIAAPVRLNTTRAATATTAASTAWTSSACPCDTDSARLSTPKAVSSDKG